MGYGSIKSNAMDQLVGCLILSIEQSNIGKSGRVYKIDTNKGPLFFCKWADCCNWVAVEWLDYELLIGATIISVEDKKFPAEQIKLEDENSFDIFGHTIKSTKGFSDIIIRNSTGGGALYGGGLEECEAPKSNEVCWVPYANID